MSVTNVRTKLFESAGRVFVTGRAGVIGVPEQTHCGHFRAFHDLEQGWRIVKIAVRFQDDCHLATSRILTQFTQSSHDPVNSCLPWLSQINLVTKDADIGRQEPLRQIDEPFPLVHLL